MGCLAGVWRCGADAPHHADGRVSEERIGIVTDCQDAIQAARIFGLKNKGAIEIGKDADFAIVDMKKSWKYEGMNTFSKTRLDCGIFEGYESGAMVKETVVRGKTVYKEGNITAESGYGMFIPRQI